MTPLNFLTFMIFCHYGEAMFGVPPTQISVESFKADIVGSLSKFWTFFLYGIVAWVVFAIPATFIAYQLLKPVLRKAMAAAFAKPD